VSRRATTLQRLVRMGDLQCSRCENRLTAARARCTQAEVQLDELSRESGKLHSFASDHPRALQQRAEWLRSLDGALAQLQSQVSLLRADEGVHLTALAEARARRRAYQNRLAAQLAIDQKQKLRRERAQAPTNLGISTSLTLGFPENNDGNTF